MRDDPHKFAQQTGTVLEPHAKALLEIDDLDSSTEETRNQLLAALLQLRGRQRARNRRIMGNSGTVIRGRPAPREVQRVDQARTQVEPLTLSGMLDVRNRCRTGVDRRHGVSAPRCLERQVSQPASEIEHRPLGVVECPSLEGVRLKLSRPHSRWNCSSKNWIDLFKAMWTAQTGTVQIGPNSGLCTTYYFSRESLYTLNLHFCSSVCRSGVDPTRLLRLMTSMLQRTTAWLCLAVALLTGIAPAQGFVVCIEEDGCVSIEVKASDADCEGCTDHESEAPASEVLASAADDEACPCIDIAVPGSSRQQRMLPRACDFQLEFVTALPPVTSVPFSSPTAHFTPRAAIPRAPDRLEHIRTVVLLR